MGILWAIAALLVLFWLGGLAFHVAGALIHLLLLIALVVIAISLFRMFARRAV